jgi:hypothetical protein
MQGGGQDTETRSAISAPANYDERHNRVKLISIMARVKTPQQKKQESYAHDRVDAAEYPHADRKNRPRFKARTKRQLRRSAKQVLASQPEEVLQLQERPKGTWHKTAVPLSEHLTAARKKRIEFEAHNIFRSGYGPKTHARFRRVVESWIKGGSEHSSALADLYRKLLNPDEQGIQAFNGPERSYERHYFLRQFFRREPALKRDFDAWIASFSVQ